MYLEAVPLACIGGILLWVASNMVKPAEIREVLAQGRVHALLMIYTAVMVPLTDFLTGVLSALILFAIASRLPTALGPSDTSDPAVPVLVASDPSSGALAG